MQGIEKDGWGEVRGIDVAELHSSSICQTGLCRRFISTLVRNFFFMQIKAPKKIQANLKETLGERNIEFHCQKLRGPV